MIRPQQTRFVLALWCVLTISSTVFAKDTTYLRRVLTTDEEGYNGIISNRALGKVRNFILSASSKVDNINLNALTIHFTKHREEKVATVQSNPKVQSLVRAWRAPSLLKEREVREARAQSLLGREVREARAPSLLVREARAARAPSLLVREARAARAASQWRAQSLNRHHQLQ
jgi:hypothetical protein